MAKEARHHHYVPQAYLRGFGERVGKKIKLTVAKHDQRRFFVTTPRNVGGARDFNRIEADGVQPDVLEGVWSRLEADAARSIRAIDEGDTFREPHRNSLLNLMAILSVRNPAMRENWRGFQEQIAQQMMGLTLATKERWESSMRKAEESGRTLPGSVSYEQALAFYESGAYSIDVPTEAHIARELEGMDIVLQLLGKRRWSIFRISDPALRFITSDRPIVLTWRHPDKVPPLMRSSPGFGMVDTEVLFPLTSRTAIAGTFDQPEIDVPATPLEGVAMANTKVIISAWTETYSSASRFPYMAHDGSIHNDSHLFTRLCT